MKQSEIKVGHKYARAGVMFVTLRTVLAMTDRRVLFRHGEAGSREWRTLPSFAHWAHKDVTEECRK